MIISPGDILVGDLNGIVVCPENLLEQAIPLIRPQVEADEKMAEAIKSGTSFTEAGKKFRTTFEIGGKSFVKEEGKGAELAS